MTNPQKQKIFVLVVAVVFFLSTSIYFYIQPTRFTAPDEIMIFSAAQQFRNTRTFVYGNAAAIDHPAAVTARHEITVNGKRVPLGFLGYPLLLGTIGTFAGVRAMYLVTPLLATLALVAYLGIVRRIFGWVHAWRSFLLLAFLPGFLFFTFKSFWHNVPFVSLLLLALYAGVMAVERRSRLAIVVSALLLGLAVGIRTNEFLWVGAATLTCLCLSPFLRSIKHITLFVVCAAMALIPVLLANNATYGNAFSFGYTTSLENQSNISENQGVASQLLHLVIPRHTTFPQYQNTFTWYGLTLSPLLAVMISIGVMALWRRHPLQKKVSLWVWLSVALSIWLFWYYGGSPYYGGFTSAEAPIIGSSFVRYLLPISIALLPLVSVGLSSIAGLFANQTMKKIFFLVWYVAYIVLSLNTVIVDQEGGVKKFLTKDWPELKQSQQQILALTEPEAVVIAGRKDKQFTPDRLVVGYNELGGPQLAAIGELLGTVPLYYNDISQNNLDEIRDFLKNHGYVLEPVGEIGQDPLYRVVAGAH